MDCMKGMYKNNDQYITGLIFLRDFFRDLQFFLPKSPFKLAEKEERITYRMLVSQKSLLKFS